jgi:hypothetical protein
MHILSKHLLVTGAAAPVCGVAVSAMLGAFGHGKLSADILAAFQVGLFGLSAVWAASFPLGFATYFAFGFAARRGWSSYPGWLSVGGVFGMLFGFMAGVIVRAEVGITTVVGLAVGVATGASLRSMWMREVNRAPDGH